MKNDEGIRLPTPFSSAIVKKRANVVLGHLLDLGELVEFAVKVDDALISPKRLFGVAPDIDRIIVKLLRQNLYVHAFEIMAVAFKKSPEMIR